MFGTILPAALLAVGVAAQQYVQNSPHSGVQYAVNIPSNTASSGSGPIYMAMVAPSGTQWLGLGQGSSMSGSNIFMMYADGNGNVTVSPRLGKGTSEPQYDSTAQITVLDGSFSHSDGSMIAYIRCDNCLSWSGGSMSATDSNSNWIWSTRSGSAIDSTSLTAGLLQHDSYGNMNLDLTAGTGGSSSNPFVVASGTTSGSGSGSSATGSATTGSGSSATSQAPFASQTGSTSSSSSSYSSSSGISDDTLRSAHGGIMAFLFLLAFPLFALTLYLPFTGKVRWVHAPLQILSIILLIVGLALGVILAKNLDILDGYHQIVGYVIVACLVFFQPALGIYQHLHYHKTGGRSALGVFHQWLGRGVIIVGVVNGGLGFLQCSEMGNSPNGAAVGYSIVAVVILIVYVLVVVLAKRRRASQTQKSSPQNTIDHEMQPPPAPAYVPVPPVNYQSQNRRPVADYQNPYPTQVRDYYHGGYDQSRRY